MYSEMVRALDAARRRARVLRQLPRRHDVHARSPRHGEAHAAHERDAGRPVRARRRARPRLHRRVTASRPTTTMLTTWKTTTAPDIVPIDSPPNAGVLSPPLPPQGPRHVPRTADRRANGARCSGCMRGMGVHRDRDERCPVARHRAQSHAPSFSPDATWSWASISRTGADAARRGDSAEANKSCKTCHELYRQTWRARHRTRAVP